MKNIPRLLDCDSNPAVRELLAVGLGDRPSQDAARKAAIGLGLGAASVATVTTGAASAASAAMAAGGTGLAATGAGALGSSVVVIVGQWIAIGLLGGVTAVGIVPWAASRSMVTRPTSGPAPATSSTRDGHSEAASVRPGTMPGTGSTPMHQPGEPYQLTVPRASSAEAIAATMPRAPADAGGTQSDALLTSTERAPSAIGSGALGQEAALVDQARRAVSSGRSAEALDVLNDYARLDRTGTLDREALALRIDALVAQRQTAAAVTLARRYLDEFPADAQFRHLRRLVSELNVPPTK